VKYVPGWLPGAEFKRYAREAQTLGRHVRNDPIGKVTAGMVSRFFFLVPQLIRVSYLVD
jgi:hypothetical protein